MILIEEVGDYAGENFLFHDDFRVLPLLELQGKLLRRDFLFVKPIEILVSRFLDVLGLLAVSGRCQSGVHGYNVLIKLGNLTFDGGIHLLNVYHEVFKDNGHHLDLQLSLFHDLLHHRLLHNADLSRHVHLQTCLELDFPQRTYNVLLQVVQQSLCKAVAGLGQPSLYPTVEIEKLPFAGEHPKGETERKIMGVGHCEEGVLVNLLSDVQDSGQIETAVFLFGLFLFVELAQTADKQLRIVLVEGLENLNRVGVARDAAWENNSHNLI